MSPAARKQFPAPPDAADASAFIRALRAVKLWAGDPSLETMRRRTGVPTSTLSDAFNPQRRRMPSLELVRAIIRACGADAAQATLWEQSWYSLRERIDAASATTPTRRNWVPRQLPPDVRGFVGRDDALDELARTPCGAPATVITGTAGVGKTALAVLWAYRIADRYPDGQIYLDLRGHAGGPVMTSAEALSLLLQSLDVPGDRIPADVHLQVGLYRSVLVGRRVLVVLDNAVDAAHVRPMLPSDPGSHALITSRDALTGLVVREGVARVTLNTLTAVDSVALLATHIGSDRVAAEPDASADLAGLCAHLPLALRIIAANLAARPGQTIAGAVAELGNADLLESLRVVDDPENAVAAAFDLSYRSLAAQTQRLFRLLGLVPGPDITRGAVAVLLDREQAEPAPELDKLLSAHLLFESSPGRYRMHDLLALYARRRATPEPDALRRLLSWYMLNTDAATRALLPSFWIEDRAELALAGTAYEFGDAEQAQAWLAAELPNLTKAIFHAAENGPAPFAWHLAHGLRGFLHTRSSGVEKLAIARVALGAAEAAGSALGQALGHMYLGIIAVTMDDLRMAADRLETAHELFARMGHARGTEAALNNLGDVCVRLGDVSRAARYLEEASAGSGAFNPNRVCNLALLARIRGEHSRALRHNADCLAYAERTGATQLIAMAKTSMAMTFLEIDDLEAAESQLREALAAAESLGSEVDAYDATAGLVLVCARSGRVDAAQAQVASLNDLIERGLYSCSGDDWAHAAIVEAHLTSGNPNEALALCVPALEQHERSGRRLTAMRLRVLLGRIQFGRGEIDAARSQWRIALEYAAGQNLPEQARIEGYLGAAPAGAVMEDRAKLQ